MITNSISETKNIASQVAEKFKQAGGVIALIGDLGAGKTTFTQGFAESLGITDKIISPTFVIERQHIIPGTHQILHHFDLYRIEGEIDPKTLGLTQLYDSSDITLIEWAEKIEDKLPANTYKIYFKKTSEEQREIILPD